MNMEVTDRLLVEAFRNGSDFAFVSLYNRHKRAVYAFALRMVIDEESAKDIVQSLFIKVYERRMQLEKPEKLRQWLLSICRNDCLSYLRKSRRTVPLEIDPDESETPHTVVSRDEECKLIGRAVGRLDAELREVVILREYEGLSYREIAEATDMSEGLVKSRLFSARRKLYQMLKPFFHEREEQ